MVTASEIYQKLQKVSIESGKTFLSLSNDFPVLIREIDNPTSSGTQLDGFEQIIKELHGAVEHQDVLLEKNRDFLNAFKKKNNGYQGYCAYHYKASRG